MLELEYSKFIEIAENQPRNEDKRKLHYLEESNKFTLYIKSIEYWEYFTIIKKEDIAEFGLRYEVSEEQAIRDFKKNVLFGAVPLKEKEVPVENLPEALSKEAGQEMIEESKDYETFLKQKFAKWEKEIFSFLDRTIEEELHKDVKYMNKSFGEFLRELFNRVNTVGFRKGLMATIKLTLKEGIKEAEVQLDMDVGFDESFNQDISWLADRQLNGFYIDGKRWKGLKGVSEDLQREVSQVVSDGIVNRDTMGEVKKQIKERIDVTDSRATAIARTETTRFNNHAKMKSYLKSNIVEAVRWDAFLDNRTSEICEALHNKEVPLNTLFETSYITKSGKSKHWQGDMPPAHTNCRSTVEPVIKQFD